MNRVNHPVTQINLNALLDHIQGLSMDLNLSPVSSVHRTSQSRLFRIGPFETNQVPKSFFNSHYFSLRENALFQKLSLFFKPIKFHIECLDNSDKELFDVQLQKSLFRSKDQDQFRMFRDIRIFDKLCNDRQAFKRGTEEEFNRNGFGCEDEVDVELLTQILLESISQKNQIRGWEDPETHTLFIGKVSVTSL